MAEIWRMDFVLAAKARGISRRRIVLAHVARNALLPVVTVLGLQSAAMLGGSVVIETVFSVPGLGRLAQEAVASRDTPLLLGIILVSAVLVISVNLVVDVVYALLDPRIGSGEAGMSLAGRFLRTPEGAAGALILLVLAALALARPCPVPARSAVDRRPGAAATVPGLVAAARHRPPRPRRAGRHRAWRAHVARRRAGGGGHRDRRRHASSARWPASSAASPTRC